MSNMIEYVIHLPTHSNTGASLEDVNEETIQRLVKHFGGASVLPCDGIWYSDTGKKYAEPVLRVICAGKATDNNDMILQAQAQVYSMKAEQLAVYLVKSDGVQILDTVYAHSINMTATRTKEAA